MKFSKRIAYCGGLSALVFSLGAGAMEGQDQCASKGKEQDACEKTEEAIDWEQLAPVVKRNLENYASDSTRSEVTRRFLRIHTEGPEYQTTKIRVVVSYHTQKNWGENGVIGEAYPIEKIIESDNTQCQKGEFPSLEVVLQEGQKFDDKEEVRIYNQLTGQAQTTQITNTLVRDTTVEFEVDIDTSLLGYVRHNEYEGEEAGYEWNRICGEMGKMGLGLKLPVAECKTSKRRHKSHK